MYLLYSWTLHSGKNEMVSTRFGVSPHLWKEAGQGWPQDEVCSCCLVAGAGRRAKRENRKGEGQVGGACLSQAGWLSEMQLVCVYNESIRSFRLLWRARDQLFLNDTQWIPAAGLMLGGVWRIQDAGCSDTLTPRKEFCKGIQSCEQWWEYSVTNKTKAWPAGRLSERESLTSLWGALPLAAHAPSTNTSHSESEGLRIRNDAERTWAQTGIWIGICLRECQKVGVALAEYEQSVWCL